MKPTHLAIMALLIAAVPVFNATAADKPAATLSGTVTYKGKPLAKGEIALHPKEGKAMVAAIKDGKYAFKSAPVGKNTVTISGDFVPKEYGSPKSSPLTFTVERGNNNAVWELK